LGLPNDNPTWDWVNPRETQPGIGLTERKPNANRTITGRFPQLAIQKTGRLWRREEKKEEEKSSSSLLGKVLRRDGGSLSVWRRIRIGAWFERRSDTFWHEAAGLASSGEISEDEMKLLKL